MDSYTNSLVRPDLIEKNYGTASNLAFNEKIKALLANGETVYHFGFGQAPFPVIERATEALHHHVGQNEYLAVKGIPQLRERLCQFHQYYDQLTFEPDQIIVGPGSKELILLLITVFNGDVLVNAPTWTTYKPQALLANRPVYTVNSSEEDQWRITPQGLQKVLQNNRLSHNKLLIICNPCNPSGCSYSERQLKELAAVCREHNILVISDEIYARLHYEHSHVSLAKVYPEGTILSSGFSKWASAGGWRLGYHIYPKELFPLLKVVACAGSHSYSCAPAPMQFAVADLLGDLPACDEYINHTTRIMKEIGMFCARELRSVGVSAPDPTAGYYLFPNFEVIRPALNARGLHTGNEMCGLMLTEARVAVLAGGPDHLRPVEELTTRLCYVNFDGSQALSESRKLGLNTPLDTDFIKTFCTPVFDGIMALKEWVNKLRAEIASV